MSPTMNQMTQSIDNADAQILEDSPPRRETPAIDDETSAHPSFIIVLLRALSTLVV